MAKYRIKFGKNEVVFVIAALGLAAQAVNSIVFATSPDPTLLALFGAILGYPIVMTADTRRRDDDDDR